LKKSRFFPFVTTTPIEDLCLAVLLIPLWWILGFRFFIFHLIVAIAFIKVLNHRKKGDRFRIPFEIYILFVFFVLYLIAILINIKNIPFPRIVGSFNNLSFWILGALIILIFYNSTGKIDLNRFLKVFPITGVLYGLFVILAISVGFITQKTIVFQSVLLKLLPDKWAEVIASKAILLGTSLNLVFVGEDRIYTRSFPRSPGFNIYGTALGLSMIVIIVLTFVYFKKVGKRKGWAIILMLEIVALVFSLSRTSVVGFGFALVIVFALLNLKKSSILKIIPVVLIFLIVFLLIIPPKKISEALFDFRKGSSIWRARLYGLTLEQANKKPVLGFGFKPRTEDFPVPIGSHSTYIGVIYRTGFLGFVVFCLFWGLVLRKWWAQKSVQIKDPDFYPLWYYSGIGLIGGLFWMITEDLDAPPIAAFLYFLVIGLILSLDKLKKSSEKQ